MNKDDFIQWRNNPVTGEFLEAVIREMDFICADLIITAGTNSLLDRFRCGRIEGMRWLADWQPQFLEENDKDESSDSGSQDTD